MRKFYLTMACLMAVALGWTSCVKTDELEGKLDGIEDRIEALEQQAVEINRNATAAYVLHTEGLVVMDIKAYDDGRVYKMEMSDGSALTIYVAEDGGNVSPVIGIDQDGNWTLTLWDETQTIAEMGTSNPIVPQVRAVEDPENPDKMVWQICTDGTNWEYITGSDGKPVHATGESITDSFFTSVVYDEAGKKVSIEMADGKELSLPVYEGITMEIYDFDMEKGASIYRNEMKTFFGEFTPDVVNAYIKCPDDWKAEIIDMGDGRHQFIVTAPGEGEGSHEVQVYLESDEHYLRIYTFRFDLVPEDFNSAYTLAWREFYAKDPNNVLLDFSYAGYDHGESAPESVTVTENADGTCTASNGYKVYNIKSYGAIPDDNASDREAFIAMLTEALGKPEPNTAGDQLVFPHSNSPRNVIFYFPEGEYILHTAADNVGDRSQSIIIRGSNIILKGAGKEKSTVTMTDPNLPSSSALYSSPDMIQLKHNTGIQYSNTLAEVAGYSPKGSFSVTVSGTPNLKAGDWVCLYLKNGELELVKKELDPYDVNPDSDWVIVDNGDEQDTGVVVKDIHQIKSVSGNTVTFYEPIMHEVEARWGWKIVGYQHYKNVGVEDITFKGNAKEDFDHHASWEDDGAYKPVSMTRVVDSWMRNVGFISVSEACSIIESANVSVYKCGISGQRGHSAIRSQASSRVFIGAVTDESTGRRMDDLGHEVTGSDPDEITGQYHAVGVSKESLGAVLWRNTWGSDGCFEAHATQPRATLIDCCTGSFRRWRQGGDANQMPNHLSDLTIWNFKNTTPFSGEWIWWDHSSAWWKFMRPIIVGFHGSAIDFNEEQTLRDESNGVPVEPESLYEAQLKNRLGYVPGWLTGLK